MKSPITKSQFSAEVNCQLERQGALERIELTAEAPFNPELSSGYRVISPSGLPGVVPAVVKAVLERCRVID